MVPNSGIFPAGNLLVRENDRYVVTWFEFSGTNGPVVLQFKLLSGTSTSYIFDVSSGNCGQLTSINQARLNQLMSSPSQFVIPYTQTGQLYRFSIWSVGSSQNFEVGIKNIPSTTLPNVVISTRRGGHWSQTTTWIGGQVPLAADSVIIDDSATVDLSNAMRFVQPVEVAYLQVGRRLTAHPCTLRGNVSAQPTSPNLKIKGDVWLNGDLVALQNLHFMTLGNCVNDALLTSTINAESKLVFTGSGSMQMSRNLPTSLTESLLSIAVRNPACTLELTYPYNLRGKLNLDSGYFNPTSPFKYSATPIAFNGESVNAPHVQVVKGKWIGVAPTFVCPSCTTVSYTYGDNITPIDSMEMGAEVINNMPVLSLRGLTAGVVKGKKISYLSGVPYMLNTSIVLPQDSIFARTNYRFIADIGLFNNSYQESNLTGGLSTKNWYFTRTVGASFNAGCQYSSPRGIRHVTFEVNSQTAWTTEVIDQSPGTLPATFTGDLTALRGKQYIRIQRTTGVQDSINLTMIMHPSDRLQDSKWDLCLAQAPTPNGPWKAISGRDSSFVNRMFRRGKARLADGAYFSLGSRQLEYNVKLRELMLPYSYQSACSNSFGLPLSVVVENLGARALDSVEIGFQTANQIVNTIWRFARPLRPLALDTVILEGPLGIDVQNTNSQPLKAWVGYPGAGNLFDDTLKTTLRVATGTAPWTETFDGLDLQTVLYWRPFNTSPLAGWFMSYDKRNHWRPLTQSFGYTTQGNNATGYSQALSATFRHPQQTQIITPGLSLSAGRWMVGYGLGYNNYLAQDTLKVQVTTDCGVSWTTLRKLAMQNLRSCCFAGRTNNSITVVDTFDLPAAQRVSVRFLVDSVRRSPFVLDIVQVASLITSIPETPITTSAELQPWYPNPSHGELHYRGNAGLATITNAAGKVVYQQPVQPDEVLDTRNWSPGLYFIRVGNSRWKVVVQ